MKHKPSNLPGPNDFWTQRQADRDQEWDQEWDPELPEWYEHHEAVFDLMRDNIMRTKAPHLSAFMLKASLATAQSVIWSCNPTGIDAVLEDLKKREADVDELLVHMRRKA